MPIKEYSLQVQQQKIPNIESRYEGLPPGINRLVNVRLDENGYITNDRGWEWQKPYPDSYVFQAEDFEACRFLGVYARHDRSEIHYLYERGGELLTEWGNGSATNARCSIKANRHIPEPNEPGTQMSVVGGKYCIISNGYDKPFKFFRSATRAVTNDFSWTDRPTPPIPIPIYAGYEAYNTATSEEDFGADTFDNESTAAQIPGNGPYGITEEDELGNVHYKYAIRYVSDTGSLSPISDAASLNFNIASGQSARFVAWLRIPKGPDNTIAVDILRTQQLSRADRNTGTASTQLFFVKRVYGNSCELVSDHTPDSELTIPASAFAADPVPISNTFNFSAVWDDRVWIGGGPDYAGQVRYSAASMPESFPLSNYFNYAGGNITAIVPYAQALFIFQENTVSVITKQDVYRSATISSNIGTTASNAIITVENFGSIPAGIMFLAKDGIYLITQDNDAFSITKISSNINATFERTTIDALPRATAVYNPTEKEAWFHFPVDGRTENTHGVVLHENGIWSFRHDPNASDIKAMSFTRLAYDGRNTIIGAVPIDTLNEAAIEDGEWINVGLHVWSATNQSGNKLVSGADQEFGYVFEYDTNDRIASLVETIWLTFGSEKFFKQLKSLEILGLGMGNQTIQPRMYIDYQDNTETSKLLETKPLQDSHYLSTTTADEVYTPATRTPRGVWNTTKINDYRPIRLLWNLEAKQVRSARFRFNTSDYFAIHSFIIDFELLNTPIHNPASRGN